MEDLRGEVDRVGSWGDWKRLTKQHTCIYIQPMETDNNVVKARGGTGLGEGEQRRGNAGHL